MTLTRKTGVMNLRQVHLVEQRGLKHAVGYQLANLRRAKRADPLQTFDPSQLLANPRFGDHPPVTHENNSLQLEAFSDFANLARQSSGVRRVTLENLDSDRPAWCLQIAD